MKLSDLLKEYRQNHDLSQRQFAEKCGISNGYISMLEKDENPKTHEPIKPSLPILKSISSAMGLTLNELLIKADDMTVDLFSGDFIKLPDNILPITRKRFPLVGSIACGEPIFADEDHETYIEASSSINADFCLVAKGDSMIDARIRNGDVVFIKKQDIVANGQIAAVIIGDEATLKYWDYDPVKQRLILSPANRNYRVQIYEGEELDTIRCLGRAICFMSNL